MRKIVIAPDSFKETLSACQVADIIAAALAPHLPHTELHTVPVADGGEGTLDALLAATAGRYHYLDVRGPLGTPVRAAWGMLGDGETAVVEMAAASGIALVPREQRDPLRACSYGTGQLIRAALDHGARRLILAIGGSATNDGGAGMLAALGARLLDAAGQPLPPGGAALVKLATLDLAGLDARLAQCRIDIACDVRNPLLGEHGASAVFGPQKGATPAMVAQLDAALAHYAAVLHAATGCDAANLPGSGAAGGMGAAALAVLGGRMQAGIELVLDAAGLAAAVQGADLVITGEGRLDGQSAFGKTPVGVATLAARYGVPTISIGGALGDGVEALQQHHIRAVFACVDRITTLDAALGNAAANLARVAGNVGALLALGAGVVR